MAKKRKTSNNYMNSGNIYDLDRIMDLTESAESEEKPKKNVIAGIKHTSGGMVRSYYSPYNTASDTTNESSDLTQELLNTVVDINEPLLIPNGDGGVIRVTIGHSYLYEGEVIYPFYPTERPDTTITSEQINKCKSLEQVQKLFINAYNSPKPKYHGMTEEEAKEQKQEESTEKYKKDLENIRDIEL